MGRQLGTVLCIGRGPIELNLRCSLLREHGWDVVSAGTGHAGVLYFRENIDLVVLDLDGDGSEAALIAGELKRLRPAVPIIFIVVDEKVLADGAADQATAVILKSEEGKILSSTLTSLLRPQS